MRKERKRKENKSEQISSNLTEDGDVQTDIKTDTVVSVAAEQNSKIVPSFRKKQKLTKNAETLDSSKPTEQTDKTTTSNSVKSWDDSRMGDNDGRTKNDDLSLINTDVEKEKTIIMSPVMKNVEIPCVENSDKINSVKDIPYSGHDKSAETINSDSQQRCIFHVEDEHISYSSVENSSQVSDADNQYNDETPGNIEEITVLSKNCDTEVVDEDNDVKKAYKKVFATSVVENITNTVLSEVTTYAEESHKPSSSQEEKESVNTLTIDSNTETDMKLVSEDSKPSERGDEKVPSLEKISQSSPSDVNPFDETQKVLAAGSLENTQCFPEEDTEYPGKDNPSDIGKYNDDLTAEEPSSGEPRRVDTSQSVPDIQSEIILPEQNDLECSKSINTDVCVSNENNDMANMEDITDSQLCDIDWDLSLPVRVERKAVQQDGTKIVTGLIKELSQLNSMILRTKREIETARRQYRQSHMNVPRQESAPGFRQDSSFRQGSGQCLRQEQQPGTVWNQPNRGLLNRPGNRI